MLNPFHGTVFTLAEPSPESGPVHSTLPGINHSTYPDAALQTSRTHRERIEAMCHTWFVTARDGEGHLFAGEVRAISLREALEHTESDLRRRGFRHVHFTGCCLQPSSPSSLAHDVHSG